MGTTILTLGVAVLVLAVSGLLIYMSQLVKNAYQIKIELQSELSDGLRRVEDEADKKLKWIKRDTFDELEKVKSGLSTDNSRRLNEIQETLNKRMQERDEQWKRDRAELIKVIERQREDIKLLDQRFRSLRRDQRRVDLVPLPLPGGGAAATQVSESPDAQSSASESNGLDPAVSPEVPSRRLSAEEALDLALEMPRESP